MGRTNGTWIAGVPTPTGTRGEGWKIVNSGMRGGLYRVIHYPTFAVSGREG